VIDLDEAKDLFNAVRAPTSDEILILDVLEEHFGLCQVRDDTETRRIVAVEGYLSFLAGQAKKIVEAAVAARAEAERVVEQEQQQQGDINSPASPSGSGIADSVEASQGDGASKGEEKGDERKQHTKDTTASGSKDEENPRGIGQGIEVTSTPSGGKADSAGGRSGAKIPSEQSRRGKPEPAEKLQSH
jgi:hypothetical protein